MKQSAWYLVQDKEGNAVQVAVFFETGEIVRNDEGKLKDLVYDDLKKLVDSLGLHKDRPAEL